MTSKDLIDLCINRDTTPKDLEEFFKKNPKVNVDEKDFITQMGALHFSSRQGNIEVVKYLIEEKKCDIDSRSTYGWSSFLISAYNGHTEVCKYLLSKGAKLEMGTYLHGYTALHLACEEGHTETVKMLLGEGADPRTRVLSGKNALELAKNEEIRELLYKSFPVKFCEDFKKKLKKNQKGEKEGGEEKEKIKIRKKDEKEENLDLDDQILDYLESKIDERSIPIVYREEHNISFMGLEKIHPFDSTKYSKCAKFLVDEGVVKDASFFIKSRKIIKQELMQIHTKKYLESLENSEGMGNVIEVPLLKYSPYFLVKSVLIDPLLYQCCATLLASELALKYVEYFYNINSQIRYSFCINLGGGMHHAKPDEGGGWCPYSDIPLSFLSLTRQKKIKKAMIIDCDAHQGNGNEACKKYCKFIEKDDLFILDVFNKDIYPHDEDVKDQIDLAVPLKNGTKSEVYIKKLSAALEKAFKSFKPDIVYYNAGSDILEGDPLGSLEISPEALILRDSLVFNAAMNKGIPIVMVLSGGYQSSNARIIANSIKNLFQTLKLTDIAEKNFKKNIKKDKMEISGE